MSIDVQDKSLAFHFLNNCTTIVLDFFANKAKMCRNTNGLSNIFNEVGGKR